MNRFFKGVMLAAVLTVAANPMVAAFAESGPPYATFDIRLEQNPQVSEVSPVVNEPIAKDKVAFHIINNTGKAVYFNSVEGGDYIPVVSNNTITVPYNVGDEYKVVDADGNLVATWNLNNKTVGVPNVASASQTEFTQWDAKLQQVIENQKVTYQEPPAKPEPRYYNSQPAAAPEEAAATTNTTVRGYW